MDLTLLVSAGAAERAHSTVEKLRRHRIERLVLTGGLAIELHLHRLGRCVETRPLNDIDFLADSFDDIPKTLSADFLFCHVHLHDPAGKTLLQCVDPETAVRVDIFRAYGGTIARAIPVELCGATIGIISVEDLTARTARLCMDLAAFAQMPAKHAHDFLRLLPLVDIHGMEMAWQAHRKPNHPESFLTAAHLLTDLIATRKDLQVVPIHSKDVHESCSRCKETEAFPLANASHILSILGYC